jgi:hypothetical protein
MIIPQTIPECFTFLKVLVDKPTLIKLQNKRREDLVDYQHDLGMFIRNNWLYSDESPLIVGLKEQGLNDYSDAALSALIIELFWEHQQGAEFKQDEFIERLNDQPTHF